MSGWDVALIVVVAAMSTAVAYLPKPKHKAWFLMMPVPFTLAVLSVNQPIDASNVLAILVLFGYALTVWALHARWQWPIVVAIAVAAVGDAAVSCAIKPFVPTGNVAFAVAAAVTFSLGVLLAWRLPRREEPHHRTQLPPYVKIPVIAAVVTGLITAKSYFGGFLTVFPMVGLVAAYECRRSLWTVVRAIPWNMITLTPALTAMRLTQGRWGLPVALVCFWVVQLIGLGIYHRVSAKTFEEEAE